MLEGGGGGFTPLIVKKFSAWEAGVHNIFRSKLPFSTILDPPMDLKLILKSVKLCAFVSVAALWSDENNCYIFAYTAVQKR